MPPSHSQLQVLNNHVLKSRGIALSPKVAEAAAVHTVAAEVVEGAVAVRQRNAIAVARSVILRARAPKLLVVGPVVGMAAEEVEDLLALAVVKRLGACFFCSFIHTS